MKKFIKAIGVGLKGTLIYFAKVFMFPWIIIAKIWDWAWDN